MRWNRMVTLIAAHAEGEVGRVLTERELRGQYRPGTKRDALIELAAHQHRRTTFGVDPQQLEDG